ncbi:MAG: ABC transporter ATP-binding protein [Coriobacteriia bacterium]
MGEAVIRTEGLTKYYGKVQALVDLDLEIPAGEIFGYLGPNGAGKTTTIRCLMDEIRPTRGSAQILGKDTHKDAVELHRHIGYLPGDLALYPRLTGNETITYFANLRGGVDWSWVEELAERLDADLGKKVGELSSGNRQKVGLIQAFMSRPRVLILDEPSSGLDPLVQRELQRLMREAAAEGATVFLSSHTLSEVQRVAHRVGIIRKGRLVALETVQALRAKAMRRVELELDRQPEAAFFEALSGVRDVVVENHHAMMSYDGEMGALLRAVQERYEIVDVSTQAADLEEVFLTYYHDPDQPDPVPTAEGGSAE